MRRGASDDSNKNSMTLEAPRIAARWSGVEPYASAASSGRPRYESSASVCELPLYAAQCSAESSQSSSKLMLALARTRKKTRIVWSYWAAITSGGVDLISGESTSAGSPPASSIRTTSVWPRVHAQCSGCIPERSTRSCSGEPSVFSHSRIGTSPCSAAQWAGVAPSLMSRPSRASGFCDASSLHVARSPDRIACTSISVGGSGCAFAIISCDIC
mmetsp:Transcript_68123/g.181352  ORF Transcript_68123/g.181352 Transcript_68123/m.181352 type:complete len:215 (-) Transcript_68123:114-758(-)